MDGSKRNIFLITFLGLLVLVKFALIPILEWQEEKAAAIERFGQQLIKGNNLLSNQDTLKETLVGLKKREEILFKDIVFTDETVTGFQLGIQKTINSWAGESELSIRNLNWLSPIKHDHAIEHRLEVNLHGPVKDFAKFILKVEQHQPKLTIVEVTNIISRMRPAAKKMGKFSGRVVLTAWQKGSNS